MNDEQVENALEQTKENFENEFKHQRFNLYSFYDTLAKRYDTPFVCQSDLFAVRHYTMVTSKTDTMLGNFKEDFELHRIGSMNMATGHLVQDLKIIKKGEPKS
jgi:hypothetical protein